jgi:hypothetical protein
MVGQVHISMKARGSVGNSILRLTFYILICLLIPAGLVKAQAVPEFTSIAPQGAKRGTVVAITLQGKNIKDTTALLFSGEGISGEIKEVKRQASAVFSGRGISGSIPNNNRLVAEVTIESYAPLGTRNLRLVTPKGISNARRFIVEDRPQMVEKEPNSTPAEANYIEGPITISGKIESVNDKDFFRFKAKRGQRFIFDVNASRMGSPLDSFLTLFSPDGKEVASNDIANGLDSLIDYTIPNDAEGEYTVQIRDLSYKGGGNFEYRLSIGQLPYLDTIFPLGGRRGMESRISVNGRNLAGVNSIQVSIAPDAPLGIQEVRVMTPSGLSTNPHPFVISNFPETTEVEPNNMRDKANSVTPPLTVNGRIELEGDVDYFTFKAKKGQRLIFDVNARRLGSTLDSLLTLFDPENKQLMVNDDATGSEARIDFTFPKDGDYSVAIRDLNSQGGMDFAYRLGIKPIQPDFRVSVVGESLDNRNRRVTTPLNNLRISRGSSTLFTVQVARVDGFNGALRFAIRDLPKDFSISPAILAPNQTQTLITLTAPPDATLGHLPVRVVGIGAIQNQRVERNANPNPIHLTVMDAPPFRLEIVQVNAIVMQSKSTTLNVRAIRDAGFVGPIALSVMGLPPRVSASQPTIPEGQTQATITINAGSFVGRELTPALSPVLTQDIVVNGSATVNNEPVTQSTTAFSLSITEVPFVLAVEPVRFSLVLPASPVASTNQEGTENTTEPQTVEAIITIKATRQGGFTDKIQLTPTPLPEKGPRLSAKSITIPDHKTEVKVTLIADAGMKPGTHTFSFTGEATINGRKFDVKSPSITAKIISGTPVASSESP